MPGRAASDCRAVRVARAICERAFRSPGVARFEACRPRSRRTQGRPALVKRYAQKPEGLGDPGGRALLAPEASSASRVIARLVGASRPVIAINGGEGCRGSLRPGGMAKAR